MRNGKQNQGNAGKPQSKPAQPAGKKITYIGNFRPAYSTENDIKTSLEVLGYEVTAVQEDNLPSRNINEVIKQCNAGDLVFYTRTWSDMGGIWNEIRKKTKVPTISVHLDLYFSLERGKVVANDPFFLSDYVFSADGGHQKEFKELGINHFPMMPGILHTSCYEGEKLGKFLSDVIFVGSLRYHPEWDYRPKLINWLSDTYKDRFRLWGTNETVRGKDLNDLYASAKVVVGDSTYSPFYWSDRVPETVGRAGFLIHPNVEGIEKNFTPYKHFIPYEIGDFKTLKEIIDCYVEDEDGRDRIRRAGMLHVKRNHTYVHRMEQIIKTVYGENA